MIDRKEMNKKALETEINMIDDKINERNELIAMHLSKIEKYKASLSNKNYETLIEMEEESIAELKREIAMLEQKKENLRIKTEDLDQKIPQITPKDAAKNALQQGITTDMANTAEREEKKVNPERTNEGVLKDD